MKANFVWFRYDLKKKFFSEIVNILQFLTINMSILTNQEEQEANFAPYEA